MTLRLMSRAGRVSSAGNVVGIVRNLIDESASRTVGRIRMLRDGATEGAAFDLPEEVALLVLAKKHELEVRGPPPLCRPPAGAARRAGLPKACRGPSRRMRFTGRALDTCRGGRCRSQEHGALRWVAGFGPGADAMPFCCATGAWCHV